MRSAHRSTAGLPLTLALMLAAASLAGISGCESARQVVARSADLPSARVVDAGITDLTADGLALTFDLEISNPYPVPLPLSDLSYALASGGDAFLQGNAPIATTIPALSAGTVSVPASVNFAALLEALSGVRPGSIVPYQADLELSADAPALASTLGPLSLPISASGELPVPAPPVIEVASITWDRLDLSNAKANIDLRVTNPNTFDVDVQRIASAISIARREVAEAELPSSVTLAPGGAASFTVPISFSPINFGSALLGMLTGDAANSGVSGWPMKNHATAGDRHRNTAGV